MIYPFIIANAIVQNLCRQKWNHDAEMNNTFEIWDCEIISWGHDSINTSDWINCVQHAQKEEEKDFAKGGVQTEVMDLTIINAMELGSEGSYRGDLH